MTNNPEVAEFTESFPTSLYMLKKKFGIMDDKFTKYVICPKCNSLYEYKECISKSISGVESPKASSYSILHSATIHMLPVGNHAVTD